MRIIRADTSLPDQVPRFGKQLIALAWTGRTLPRMASYRRGPGDLTGR